MACEFPVAVKAKLMLTAMLTAMYCLLYFTYLLSLIVNMGKAAGPSGVVGSSKASVGSKLLIR